MAATTGTQVSPASRKLTSSERYELIAQVRLSFHYQRSMLEVLRTGVGLGAEEVQDQRLLAAETPPEPNPALDIFVFLVMWALEGPLVSGLIAGVQRTVVSALKRHMRLQSRAYQQIVVTELRGRPALDEARKIARSRTGKALKRTTDASQGGAAKQRRARDASEASEAAQRELAALERQRFPGPAVRAGRSELRSTAIALKGIRDADVPDFIVAVPKVALQQPITFGQAAQDAGVSPGVSLRAQVEKRAIELIQDSYLQQEHYELKLNLLGEAITENDAADALEDIGDQGPINVAGVLDQYRIATAGIIWAQLLETSGLRARRAREQDARTRTLQQFAGDPASAFSALFTAPEKHQSYLIARFGEVAEAWARNAPDDVLLPGSLPRRMQTPQEVDRYLKAGSTAAPKGVLEAVRQSLGFSVDPALLRLDLVLQWLSALAEQTAEKLLLEAP